MKQTIQVNVYCPEGIEVLINVIKLEKGIVMTDVDILFDAIEQVTGISKRKIEGSLNTIPVREVRWMAYLVLRDIIGLGPTDIGKLFNKDHSVVIWGINRIKSLMSVYHETFATYESILATYQDFIKQPQPLNIST